MMDTQNTPPLIYSKIIDVMRAVGSVGKDRKNQQQGYSFRGIDDMYNALHEPMAAAGIFCAPKVLSYERQDRTNKNGTVLLYTVATVRHTFYASDGSSVDVETIGEAMDSGDKSCNKAQSAAYKYALMEIFCIPTEEKFDTEYESHELERPQQANQPQDRPQPATGTNRPAAANGAQNGQAQKAPKLTAMEKLMNQCERLKYCVDGEGKAVVKHIQNVLEAEGHPIAVTPENLKTAWTTIKTHYEPKSVPADTAADPNDTLFAKEEAAYPSN